MTAVAPAWLYLSLAFDVVKVGGIFLAIAMLIRQLLPSDRLLEKPEHE